jgi:hypothetical protein
MQDEAARSSKELLDKIGEMVFSEEEERLHGLCLPKSARHLYSMLHTQHSPENCMDSDGLNCDTT